VPSGPFLQRLIKAGVFQKLDKSKLPNLTHMWPEVMQRLQVYDPGNQFAVNYMWGTTGIGVNVPKVRQRLGNQPFNTWDVVMRPEIVSKLKDCGVQMLDAPEDIFPNVLNYLGLNPDSKKQEDLTRAGDALFRIRGSIQKFHSSEYINALANGDICMAVGYSGDVLQAKKRAEEAKNNVEIAYVIPREGALMWFDSIAIPADAKNVAEAHEFIDYLLRPEVAAANTNFVAYAAGNLAAKQFVNPEILNNPGVYPDEATFKRLFTNTAYDERSQRVVTRAWTRVKTGR
jgi:putrescine transport system substrate-binding protein